MIPQLHTIGRVAGTHGFNGEISIHLNDGIPEESIEKGSFIFISFDGKGVPFLVEQYNQRSGVLRIKFVMSQEQAEEFEGRSILLEAHKVAIQEIPDFTGFTLINHKMPVGKVTKMESYPAGFMMTVKTDSDEIIIPLVEDWIIEINDSQKAIAMELPEGLTDMNK